MDSPEGFACKYVVLGLQLLRPSSFNDGNCREASKVVAL